MTAVTQIIPRKNLAITLLFAPLSLLPLISYGQQSITPTSNTPQTRSTQAFEAITVMGEAESEQMPWTTQVDRQTLDEQQIQNWSQLGNRAEPSVNFSTNTNSVNIRGLDQNRVLTRVDGIRLPYLVDIRGVNGGVSGGLSAIDFNALSSIDIVRGADSSTVGSGAMGGVVDVRSLSPSDLLAPDQSVGVLAKTGYYSVDNSWLVNGAVAGQATNGLQWLVQAGAQFGHETKNQGTNDGYGSNRTVPNPDDYTQQNYQIKLQQSIQGGHTIGLAGSYFKRQDDINDRTANPQLYESDQSELTEKTTRQSVALNYAWAATGNKPLIDSFAAQTYWQNVEVSSDLSANRLTTPVGAYQRDNSIKEDSWGIDLEGTKRVDGDISQRWAFGGDWRASKLKQYAGGQDNCPPPPYFGRFRGCAFFHNNQSDIPETTGNQYALWLENTVGFAQDRFTLTPGLRYDHYEYSPSTDSFGNNNTATQWQSNSGSAWSPKLLTNWSVTPNLDLYAQYALSFNAPTATQLYSRFGTPGQYLVTGNQNLNPEKGRGWELGAKYSDSTVSGSLTYFDNRYDNFIESVTGPGTAQYPFFVQSFENLDDVRIYGIEARGKWQFSSAWRTFASLAWTVGQDQSTGRYLNSVAPLKAIVGFGYATQEWGASAQLSAAAARNKVAYPESPTPAINADFKAPGYGVIDLTAYWRPSQVKGLSLQAGVFNLFDKTYWNALDVPTSVAAQAVDRYTQPGRNFSVSLTYQY